MRDELRVVRITVETELADHVTDLLWQFGPDAVAETASAGTTTFVAGYPSAEAARAAHSCLSGDHAPLLETVPPGSDWVRTWRSAEPSHEVGPFHLRLPEHATAGDRIDLVIEPGATFGFSHASTLLAIELLSRMPVEGAIVADVGCGSGVLGIACGLAGAGAVDAVDIDPAAVAATLANATDNGVDVRATTGSVGALPRSTYDVVVANMLATTLETLADDLLQRTDAAGTIVLSGMLAPDETRVRTAFGPHAVVDRCVSGEWLALTLRPDRYRGGREGGSLTDPAL